MKPICLILWMLFFAGLAVGDESQRTLPLAEGFLVAGVEGRVAKDPNNPTWEFFPAAAITAEEGLLPAARPVPLLPCSVLEQMTQLAGERRSVDVRLWAMATEYQGQNYLYALYFLPVQPPAETAPPAPTKPTPAEPKEKESVLPDEILQMMQRNRMPDLKRLDEITVVSADRNLIHRTGLMQTVGDAVIFSPDAFGQNIAQDRFRLLPCKTLESVQRAMRRTPGRQRYVVSGVVTEFEGQTYLLPRRAVRTYTHGNFTP